MAAAKSRRAPLLTPMKRQGARLTIETRGIFSSTSPMSTPTSSRLGGITNFRGVSSRLSAIGSSRKLAPYAGLKNLGNTCYLNAALQLLFFAPTFRTYLNTLQARIEREEVGINPDGSPMIHERMLVQTLIELWEKVDERRACLNDLDVSGVPYSEARRQKTSKPVDSREFMAAVGKCSAQFANPNLQQDVQEFLRFLLGTLHDLETSFGPALANNENEPEPETKAEAEPEGDTSEEKTISSESSTDKPQSVTRSRKRKLDELLETQRRMARREGPESKRRRTRNSSRRKRKLQEEGDQEMDEDGEEFEEEEEVEDMKLGDQTTPIEIKEESVDTTAPPSTDPTPPEPTSAVPLIENLFQGDTLSSIKCLKCNAVSTRLEPFFDLSLPIEHKQNLLWSLSHFVAEETMTGSNQYYCSSCKVKTDAVRHSRFSSLPQLLSIHLKRFTYNNQQRYKVPYHVECPMYLQFDSLPSSPRYELTSLIMHKGSYSSCGHYVACIRSPSGLQRRSVILNRLVPVDPTESTESPPSGKKSSSKEELSPLLVTDVEIGAPEDDLMIDVMAMDDGDESSEEEVAILSSLIAGEIAEHIYQDGPLEMESSGSGSGSASGSPSSSSESESESVEADDADDEDFAEAFYTPPTHAFLNNNKSTPDNAPISPFPANPSSPIVALDYAVEMLDSDEESEDERNPEEDWLYFDDGKVTYLNDQEVMALTQADSQSLNTAYIVLYRRVEEKANDKKTPAAAPNPPAAPLNHDEDAADTSMELEIEV